MTSQPDIYALAHPFTRRSSIQADESIPIELTAIAFWLAVLCWKRAAQ